MKVLLINGVCGTGSTGKICAQLAEGFEKEGHTVKIAYGRDGFVPEQYQKYAVRIGRDLDVRLHGVYTRLTDRHGFASWAATRKFLRWAEEYNPDLLWLHNIHGYYLNIELLFQWIKSRPNMQVKWTLHDCWTFTGHCAYFDFVHCEKWKVGCKKCPQYRSSYPYALFKDGSKTNYLRKKAAFTGLKNVTIVTPSKWLGRLVKESYLGKYDVRVIPNGIDLKRFVPKESKKRTKHLILGVANVWDRRKGLDYLKKLLVV